MSYFTLDISSCRVKDTVGHTSMTAFSVDSELLHYFPGHADAFQILLYGVYPVLSWSSRLSFCTIYIPVYSLFWQSAVVQIKNADFRPIKRYTSETIEDTHITMEY